MDMKTITQNSYALKIKIWYNGLLAVRVDTVIAKFKLRLKRMDMQIRLTVKAREVWVAWMLVSVYLVGFDPSGNSGPSKCHERATGNQMNYILNLSE